MVGRLVSPRLTDMIEAMERIRYTVRGLTLDVFEQDWERRWLVERGIEIISEASRHLHDGLKARQTSVPWSKVAGIGNILRHAYDRAAPDILWKVVQDDLPLLEQVCREELIRARALEENGD